jgi:orotate phosphoribosyltransferase
MRAGQPRVLFEHSLYEKSRSHGTGQLIEGPFLPGDRVAIVEDVITTGASRRAAGAVRSSGGIIAGVLAVVDRNEGRETLEEQGLPVIALTTAADIIERMV